MCLCLAACCCLPSLPLCLLVSRPSAVYRDLYGRWWRGKVHMRCLAISLTETGEEALQWNLIVISFVK